MKIALFARPDNPYLVTCESLFRKHQIDYLLNDDSLERCTHAVSLGGDGTFLSAVRRMGSSRRLPLLGVNSGRLGFLATVSLSRVEKAIEALKRGDYSIERRTMIEVSGIGMCDNLSVKPLALNEFSVQKHGTAMIEIELSIDGVLAASYWADGVIVSTPTGSTAYSMSVSGSIIAPSCGCLVISPIAPHNLSIRPLVVSDRSRIELKVRSRSGAASIVTLDNREYEALSGSSYVVTLADQTQDVILLEGSNFYNTLREKLHWGVDLRN